MPSTPPSDAVTTAIATTPAGETAPQAPPDAAPFPNFTDGPPAPERGRANLLAATVLVLGAAALFTGFGPLLHVTRPSGTLTANAFVVPQGLLVIAALLFSSLVAGLSMLPRLARVRGATPVLHAVSTAAATAGALLAAFALIVVAAANQAGDLVSGLVDDRPVVVGLGWAGITILVLAATQAVAAFVALAYDTGLAQTRRSRGASESAQSGSPTPADPPTTPRSKATPHE